MAHMEEREDGPRFGGGADRLGSLSARSADGSTERSPLLGIDSNEANTLFGGVVSSGGSGSSPSGSSAPPTPTGRTSLVIKASPRQPHRPPIDMLNDTIEHIGFGKFQIKLFLLMAFAKFVDAMETAMLPLLFPILKELWHLKNTDLACIAAATQIGMLFGAVGVGRVSDSIGRRLPLQISLFWLMAFGLTSAAAPNVLVFIIVRGLLGIGYGGNMVMAYTMLAETLPSKQRGPCLAALDVFFGLGALFSCALAWLVIPAIGWRWLIAICIFLCIPVVIGLMFFPDSPRYQCAAGKYDKCIKTLQKMAKDNKKELPPWMTLENMKIAAQGRRKSVIDLALERRAGAGGANAMPTLFGALKPYLFILVPLGATWFFNALAGVVVAWVPLYLAEHGGHNMKDVYIAAIVMALGTLAGGLMMTTLLTFFGRLPLLRITLFVVCGLCTGMGFLQGTVALTTMLWFIEVGKGGVINVLYTYTPEVFPTRIRSTAFGLCSGLHRLAPAISPFLVSYLMDHFNFTVLCCIFAGLFLLTLSLTFFLSVETMGQAIVEDTPHAAGKKHSGFPPGKAAAGYGATTDSSPPEQLADTALRIAQRVPWYRRFFCQCGVSGAAAKRPPAAGAAGAHQNSDGSSAA